MNPILAGLFSTPAASIYGVSKMAQNQGNAMMGNYNLANRNNLNLENYITLDGTNPVVDEGQLLSDTNYFGPPTNIQYPGGNPVYPRSVYQDRIMNKNLMNMDRGNIDNRFSFNFPNLGIMSMAKRMVEPNTPEENFGRGYFNMDSSGRTYGNQADDLFAGKNVVSAFGQGMGAAGQKRMDTIENTLRTKYNLSDDEIEDVYSGTYAGPVNSQLISRLQNFNTQLNNYKQALAAGTGGADTTPASITTTTTAPGTGTPTGTGGGYSGPKTSDFNQAQFARSGGRRADKPGGFTDPGKGSYGPHMAQGGRIGYRDAGPVEEQEDLNVFEFMKDQGIPSGEMASYDFNDAMGETYQMFLDGKKNGTVPIDMEFDEYLELLPDQSGIMNEEGIASIV